MTMTQGGEAVSRLVHTQEIAGSIPAPATTAYPCRDTAETNRKEVVLCGTTKSPDKGPKPSEEKHQNRLHLSMAGDEQSPGHHTPTPRQRHDWWLLNLLNGPERARQFRPDLAQLFAEESA